MTPESTILVWALGGLVVSAAVVFLILFFAYRVRVPRVADQVATAVYAFTYDDALQWLGVSGRKRKAMLAELGSHIIDASADAPVSDVLGRLGNPKDLARAVAATRRGPSWGLGACVALTIGFAMQLGAFVGLDVLANGLEALGAADATVHATTFLLPGVEFDMTTDAAGALDEIAMTTGPAFWVAPIVAFALFSRPWRLLTHRRAATVEA